MQDQPRKPQANPAQPSGSPAAPDLKTPQQKGSADEWASKQAPVPAEQGGRTAEQQPGAEGFPKHR